MSPFTAIILFILGTAVAHVSEKEDDREATAVCVVLCGNCRGVGHLTLRHVCVCSVTAASFTDGGAAGACYEDAKQRAGRHDLGWKLVTLPAHQRRRHFPASSHDNNIPNSYYGNSPNALSEMIVRLRRSVIQSTTESTSNSSFFASGNHSAFANSKDFFKIPSYVSAGFRSNNHNKLSKGQLKPTTEDTNHFLKKIPTQNPRNFLDKSNSYRIGNPIPSDDPHNFVVEKVSYGTKEKTNGRLPSNLGLPANSFLSRYRRGFHYFVPNEEAKQQTRAMYQLMIGNSNEDTVQLMFPYSDGLEIQHQYIYQAPDGEEYDLDRSAKANPSGPSDEIHSVEDNFPTGRDRSADTSIEQFNINQWISSEQDIGNPKSEEGGSFEYTAAGSQDGKQHIGEGFENRRNDEIMFTQSGDDLRSSRMRDDTYSYEISSFGDISREMTARDGYDYVTAGMADFTNPPMLG